MRKGFFSKSEISDVVLARADNDVQDALSGLITAKESAYSKLGKALTNHDLFFSELMKIKKRLATDMYMKSVKLLGRMLLGPASRMNVVNDVGNAVTGNNVHGGGDANAQRNSAIGDNATANNILSKFGGFKIKSEIASAIVSALDWVDHEIKKEVGMNISEEVIHKVRKPGTTVPQGARNDINVTNAGFGALGQGIDNDNVDNPWIQV